MDELELLRREIQDLSERKSMHLSDEPNVEVLRHKARILEGANSRLVKKTAELWRENLLLRGMAAEQVEQNLPGLLSQLTLSSKASEAPGCTSERGPRAQVEVCEKKPQRGHGPTEARRQGARLTTQALWDQLEALGRLLRELPVRIAGGHRWRREPVQAHPKRWRNPVAGLAAVVSRGHLL